MQPPARHTAGQAKSSKLVLKKDNHNMTKLTVALAGNPNSGKTTIFNMLTGARQRVANYPGVTVESKQGLRTYRDYQIKFVDLPGTYSLTAYSAEELIARNFIIEQNPDVVVDVVDASNIERNLYLATQLMELDVPVVLAFNMSDIAKQKGLVFDTEQISKLLEAAIVPTVGSREKGKTELLDAIIQTIRQGKKPRTHKIGYGQEIEEEIEKIQKLIEQKLPRLAQKYGQRWLAIKLLEHDKEIIAQIESPELLDNVTAATDHLRAIFAEEPEIIMADKRYGFISGACQETIKTTVESRHSASDSIDAVVINRVLGLPIFLLLMFLVFVLTFRIGQYPMSGLEHFFNWTAKP